jgi:SAM-dependent methyltransferase
MNITFRPVQEFEGWDAFPSFIEDVITRNSLRRICEVGAGANPAVSPDFVRRYGLQYTAVDESDGEVRKSGVGEVVDVCAQDEGLPGAPYDLVCSRMTAEHFCDSEKAFRNMFRSLAPGGLSVHSFATLYAWPFLLNRLLPQCVSSSILNIFAPRDREQHDKFKAYYSHCRGPIPSQLKFFRRLGYEILEYRSYFGHEYYKKKLRFLDFLQRKTTQLLVKAPVACLTTYATVILRRPSFQSPLKS